jgi:hypothetical protein
MQFSDFPPVSDPGTHEDSSEKSATDSPFMQYSRVNIKAMPAGETETSSCTKSTKGIKGIESEIGKENKDSKQSKASKEGKESSESTTAKEWQTIRMSG